MNRTLTGVVLLAMIGIAVVAMVQAQESAPESSQTKSVLIKTDGQPGPTVTTANSQGSSRRQNQLAQSLEQSRDQAVQEYATSPSSPAGNDFPVTPAPSSDPGSLALPQPGTSQQFSQEPPLLTPPMGGRSLTENREFPAKASLRDDPTSSRRTDTRLAPATEQPILGDASPRTERGVRVPQTALLTSQTPAVLVKAEGPAEIHVGETAIYRVDVANHAGEMIEDFYVRLVLPQWINLEESKAGSGDLRRQDVSDGSQVLIWKLPKMQAQAQSHWELKMVPTENKPFDLSVDWWVRPKSLQAGIRVVKPELQLAIRGPSEMVYGEEKKFTLSVTNPGNGDADNVAVILTPGDEKPHWIGHIPAGGSRQLEFDMSAAQAGMMQLRAVASGDRKLQADVDHAVMVRQPRLQVEVAGPTRKYAGSQIKYQVVLANRGDAAANDILIRAALPNGVTLIPGEGQVDAANGTMAWQLGTLGPGMQRKFDFTCQLETAGEKTIQVSAEAQATNMVSSTAVTQVTGVADLKLAVNDPQGPQVIGEEVVYEVQVINRGSKAAEAIKLVAQFSNHIEPVRVSGAQAELVPGQALFRPLQRLEPGQQVTLKVFAKASQIGNHRFRAELTSEDPETQLVQEEMTRFIIDPDQASDEPVNPGSSDD